MDTTTWCDIPNKLELHNIRKLTTKPNPIFLSYSKYSLFECPWYIADRRVCSFTQNEIDKKNMGKAWKCMCSIWLNLLMCKWLTIAYLSSTWSRHRHCHWHTWSNSICAIFPKFIQFSIFQACEPWHSSRILVFGVSLARMTMRRCAFDDDGMFTTSLKYLLPIVSLVQ